MCLYPDYTCDANSDIIHSKKKLKQKCVNKFSFQFENNECVIDKNLIDFYLKVSSWTGWIEDILKHRHTSSLKTIYFFGIHSYGWNDLQTLSLKSPDYKFKYARVKSFCLFCVLNFNQR